MLVDLGRNDVGRVSRPGTVKVEEREVIERYSHVMHMVSQVSGTLDPGLDAWDVIAAAFPAGTVSGAPEGAGPWRSSTSWSPISRGPYAGAAGYVGFDGDMDLAIVIRSVALERAAAALPGRGRHRARQHAGGRVPGDGAQAPRRPGGHRRRRGGPVILVVDNYDSFTFNLVQALQSLGAEVEVHRNDEISRRRRPRDEARGGGAEPRALHARPRRASRFRSSGRSAARCPSSASASGTSPSARRSAELVRRAGRVVHGKTSPVSHEGTGPLHRAAAPAAGRPLPLAGGGPRARCPRCSRSPRSRPTTGRSWRSATAAIPPWACSSIRRACSPRTARPCSGTSSRGGSGHEGRAPEAGGPGGPHAGRGRGRVRGHLPGRGHAGPDGRLPGRRCG